MFRTVPHVDLARDNAVFMKRMNSIVLLNETKKNKAGKPIEFRVAITPEMMKRALVEMPWVRFVVARGAGSGIGLGSGDWTSLGKRVTVVNRHKALATPGSLFVQVKETPLEDHTYIAPGAYFSYQHFAGSEKNARKALDTSFFKNVAFVAWETMQDSKGNFPALAPMSEAAASIVCWLFGAHSLKPIGPGTIPSGLPECGIEGSKAVILGGGVVGRTAMTLLSRMGLREINILEISRERMEELQDIIAERSLKNVHVLESNPENLAASFKDADAFISGIYVRGKNPPKVITKPLLKLMKKGAKGYPVDIDQGGAVEPEIKETSIRRPLNLQRISGTDVNVFAPPNLPSMAARNTSKAISEATYPFMKEIVTKGLVKAALDDQTILTGVNIFQGHICEPGVAETFNLQSVPFGELVGA